MSPAPAVKEGTVLIVEDEAPVRRFLQTTLIHNGYRVTHAANGAAALAEMRSGEIGLVLLDLGLPDVDGLVLTRQLRKESQVPIIVVSARDSEAAKIDALDGGANDYVTKPFGAGELLARIRAALRVTSRGRADTPRVLETGDLKLDIAARQVFLGDREISMTPNEFDLLTLLMKQAGKVVSHKELLRRVWGPHAVEEVQYLRVYMRQLRYKLEPEPAQPRYLVTVPGVGYRMKLEG